MKNDWLTAIKKDAAKARLMAAASDLLALVEQVEWLDRDEDQRFCPWCGAWSGDEGGHDPDCPRQAALAKVYGKPAP